HPTVAELAGRLHEGAGPDRPALERLAHDGEVPASFAQQRLVFDVVANGPSPLYNVPIALRISGELDVAALGAALGDVVARHEPLRTVFVDLDAAPAQRVLDPAQAGVDLAMVPTTAETLAADLAAEAGHCFDLASEAPVRACLLRLGAGEHVLSLLVHHVAVDEWSTPRLLGDLAGAYRARRRGEAPAWPPLPVRYADYALWQRRLLGSPEDPDSLGSRQLAFWTEALQGAPEQLQLPADRPRPAVASRRGGVVDFTVPPEVHAGLRALARRAGATMFMVLHAGLAALLTRLGAGTDVVVGTPVAGRADQALDELVGFFVNTVVLRADTSGDPGFAELVARVRRVDLAAFDHQDLPFERVVEALNPRRSPSRHPLFQVMLTHQVTGDDLGDWGELAVRPEAVGTGTAKFDLAFAVCEDPPGEAMNGTVEYRADLFDAGTVDALAERFVRLLSQVAAEPDRR
ncbi:MAG: non-ribosomal peptide synthetase, partial [Actinobacteria bacterium]|nr:non-ribosomal peptide synthetase [Actinomycetota bacterium]